MLDAYNKSAPHKPDITDQFKQGCVERLKCLQVLVLNFRNRRPSPSIETTRMYHKFIKRQVHNAFDDLTHARVERHLERFHDHASLRTDRGGAVTLMKGQNSIAAGLQSEFVEPGWHRFEINHIVVSGWPWNTHIAVHWLDTGSSSPTSRQGMNFIQLKFGKVVKEYLFAGANENSND